MTTVDLRLGDRRDRLVAPVATLTGLTLATVALRLRDPHQHLSWGMCPSAALGISCPGCGGLRAVNDLTHGHVVEAASSNLLFVLSLPLIVVALAVWTRDRWTGRVRETSPRTAQLRLAGFVVVALTFAVLRNLPGSWLAP